MYPVLINALLLCAFGFTLFFPPPMAFRLALLQDKTIGGSLAEKRIAEYCRKVTLVWCVFFILNGGMALRTVFFASDRFWSVYNGGLSYILMGLIFAGEFVVRKMADKKMPKAIPLSQFCGTSRSPAAVLCYEETWQAGKYKTWGDFLEDTARLRRVIAAEGSPKWILHTEDYWYFLVAFTSLLQCGKQVLLSANVSPAYIAEIRDRETAFLTDIEFPPAQPAGRGEGLPPAQVPGDVLFIPRLLADARAAETPPVPGGNSEERSEEIPRINADETVIIMYTSGSTGRPKAVRQRLTEFETDNRFILSKWGEEWLARKVCSTVSQHHIYGLLFSVLLPFTAGVPFRRRRIDFPEELERFTDGSYMIITVPAFLKRAVEVKSLEREGPRIFPLRSPWIFTSGGVLSPEIAEKTGEIFGFWPVEVYGSTETSGIAWRQSKDGLEWTPFDNAEIRKNEAGCLVVRSPYIKDPAGFATGDLVDIHQDGRFILMGRADSIVKIEEKRISLPELENRLMSSGLVADLCVVAMEDRRQYLAAALVLNGAGQEKFRGREKHEINRYFREYLLQFFENTLLPKKWRYLDSLPTDSLGKKKKEEIQALFSPKGGTPKPEGETPPALSPGTAGGGGSPPAGAGFPGRHGIPDEKVLERGDGVLVLEVLIPPECDYFDGHFPAIKVLPAIAQFELVIRLASRYLGTGIHVAKINRIKFSNLIRPGAVLHIKLTLKPPSGAILFVITSPGGRDVYSTGSILPDRKS
jgi:acyl-coenzyme A synthetase/AMP-(fatty) acid ligase/3-hydroxymyristoyl/3-hydroxydecanoyl-(acyl carrier protein) dehydratase